MPRVKSRNYAEAYKSYAAQVIPQIDPREIGSTFHRAGAEIAEKGHFWMETNDGSDFHRSVKACRVVRERQISHCDERPRKDRPAWDLLQN
jgi:hypothetical protein